MKRWGLIFIFLSIMTSLYAQEKVVVDSISGNQKNIDRLHLSVGKPSFYDDGISIEKFSLVEPFSFKQPLLPDYSKNLDIKNLINPTSLTSGSYSLSGYGFSPFLFSGNVFNQANYRVSDRFTLGGNSFGIRSILEPPRMNSSIQNMSTKGVSMYMQYNVSKNIKVETRVSISNHSYP